MKVIKTVSDMPKNTHDKRSENRFKFRYQTNKYRIIRAEIV